MDHALDVRLDCEPGRNLRAVRDLHGKLGIPQLGGQSGKIVGQSLEKQVDEIVRVYTDMNANGVYDPGTDIFLGQTVATPISGRARSLSSKPMALSMPRAAARSGPSVSAALWRLSGLLGRS